MHRRSKLLLAALSATALLAVVVSGASANRLSLSENRFTLTWASFSQSTIESTVSCPLTLSGSFHSRTLGKTRNALVGYINAARTQVERCTGGRTTLLTMTLPWHIRYRSFTGTLPRITGIKLDVIDMSVRWFMTNVMFINECLWRSSAVAPLGITANISSETVTSVTADPTAGIDNVEEIINCDLEEDTQWSGTARVSPTLTVRLI